jgi:hypothetical protein
MVKAVSVFAAAVPPLTFALTVFDCFWWSCSVGKGLRRPRLQLSVLGGLRDTLESSNILVVIFAACSESSSRLRLCASNCVSAH